MSLIVVATLCVGFTGVETPSMGDCHYTRSAHAMTCRGLVGSLVSQASGLAWTLSHQITTAVVPHLADLDRVAQGHEQSNPAQNTGAPAKTDRSIRCVSAQACRTPPEFE